MSTYSYSQNFYWGAATSAHQVEGNNKNDWTKWEIENAKLKVQNAKLQKWPEYILKNYPNPLQEENYISGSACGHYSRFREDFDIAKSLGHNAHRFSVEWSRIEPEEGRFDQKEIEHYRAVIYALRERNIEPFVTLWHCTIPLWFRDKGGWEAYDATLNFQKFCDRISQEFKNDVKYWIILNEPALWARMAHGTGIFPPGKKSFFKWFQIYKKLLGIHRKVYINLKKMNPSFQIGIAENMSWIGNPILKPFVNYFRNFYFLRNAGQEIDFIGLNYYRKIYNQKINNLSDVGWEIYPEGLHQQLRLLSQFKKPIFITENGIADARDVWRDKFIREHIKAMKKAIYEGVDVRGYFYWSLLDNFEWEKGFWPRFGLVEVDYKTMERKIRHSALEYAKLIKQ